ncbi:FimV/HubP family polar landmark protein, partial [Congregibacter sp.]
AAEQLEELHKHGSPDAISRGEALLGGGVSTAAAPSVAADTLRSAAPTLDIDDDLNLEPPAGLDSDVVEISDTLELSMEDAESEELRMEAARFVDDGIESIDFEHLEIEEDGALDGADDELDFSNVDEQLDLSDALVAPQDMSADRFAPEVDDIEGEELLIADDADQMATKLDLARAYLDMGDSEGARGILEEVIEKGTDEQQQESRDLLTRIA